MHIENIASQMMSDQTMCGIALLMVGTWCDGDND